MLKAVHSLLGVALAAGSAGAQITTLPRRVTAPVQAAARARDQGVAAALPQDRSGAGAQTGDTAPRGTPAYGQDPFRTLIEPPRPGAKPLVRPLGRQGLSIEGLTVQGVAVGGPLGPVALVASQDERTYFLHPGDRVFDGTVSRIEATGVWFRRLPPPGQKGAGGGEVFRKVS